LPQPNESGPEFGSNINNIIKYIYEKDDAKYKTNLDGSIYTIELINEINSLSIQSDPDKKPEDSEEYALSEFTDFYETINISLYQNTDDSIESSKKQRESILNDANESLRKIEIITGNISGLGILDIISIIGALYLVPKKSLVGLLDDDAYDRANKKIGGLPQRNEIKKCIEDLSGNVSYYYKLIDFLYDKKIPRI